jgi:hypothetical protein
MLRRACTGVAYFGVIGEIGLEDVLHVCRVHRVEGIDSGHGGEVEGSGVVGEVLKHLPPNPQKMVSRRFYPNTTDHHRIRADSSNLGPEEEARSPSTKRTTNKVQIEKKRRPLHRPQQRAVDRPLLEKKTH